MKIIRAVKVTSVENGYVVESLDSLTASIANTFPDMVKKLVEVFDEEIIVEFKQSDKK